MILSVKELLQLAIFSPLHQLLLHLESGLTFQKDFHIRIPKNGHRNSDGHKIIFFYVHFLLSQQPLCRLPYGDTMTVCCSVLNLVVQFLNVMRHSQEDDGDEWHYNGPLVKTTLSNFKSVKRCQTQPKRSSHCRPCSECSSLAPRADGCRCTLRRTS